MQDLGLQFIIATDRDSRSYIGYLGFQHAFLPNLSVNAEGGFQYTESYNDPQSSPSLAPYAVLSAVYTYAPGSYAQIGFTESQNATDVVAPDTQGRITLYQQSSTVYASINHKLTPKLLGTVIGRWQHSVFNEGLYNNLASDYYSLGVNLSYSFTPHFSGDAGYNFDDVQSPKIRGVQLHAQSCLFGSLSFLLASRVKLKILNVWTGAG